MPLQRDASSCIENPPSGWRPAAAAVLLVAIVVAGPTLARGASAPALQQAGEWREIQPDGESGCALDTPYSFFIHRGPDPSRLLIYFQGGGACWDWVSCSGLFDSTVQPDEISEYRGIFDFDNPDNPFRDFTVVFVPYCTGDVHVGDTTRRYGDDPGVRPIHHWGYRNVSAVLAWVDEQGFNPRQVIVAGASAGSYGALFHAPRIARLHPSASLTLIGDSGLPLLNDYPAILYGWDAAPVLRRLWKSEADLDARDLTLERAYAEVAAARPDAVLAQITSDRDAVQSAFYLISGSPRWRAATYELLDSLTAMLPSFRSFVVAGSDHGLLRTDAFYSYQADTVRLRDWVQDLVDERPVVSRRCRECRSP